MRQSLSEVNSALAVFAGKCSIANANFELSVLLMTHIPTTQTEYSTFDSMFYNSLKHFFPLNLSKTRLSWTSTHRCRLSIAIPVTWTKKFDKIESNQSELTRNSVKEFNSIRYRYRLPTATPVTWRRKFDKIESTRSELLVIQRKNSIQ